MKKTLLATLLFISFLGKQVIAQQCPTDSVFTLTYINNLNQFAFIDSVNVDNNVITTHSGVDSINSYQRFSAPIIQLQQGGTHYFYVHGPSNVYTSTALFIDLNQDHFYDPVTELIAAGHFSGVNGVTTLMVTLPIDVISDTLDLRIVRVTDPFNIGISTACNFSFTDGGEVEDYKAFINCGGNQAVNYDPYPLQECFVSPRTVFASAVYGQLNWFADTTQTTIYSGNDYSYNPTGTDTVFYIQNNIGGCKSSFYSITISMLPLPIVNILAPDTIISCTAVNLSADGGYTEYFWSNGDLGQYITIGSSISGPLSVSVQDMNGCLGSDVIYAQIAPNPPQQYAHVNLDYDFCNNHLGALTYDSIINPATVMWYNALNSTYIGTGSNLPYTFPTPGNYQFTANINSMCGDTVAALNITIDPLPHFDSIHVDGANILPNGNFLICAATSQHKTYLTGLVGHVDYWQLIDITSGFSSSYGYGQDTINLPMYLLNPAHTYGVILHLLNTQNCAAVTDTLIGNLSTPGMNIQNNTWACSFPYTLGNPGLDYSTFDVLWSTGDTTRTISIPTPGNYTVTVTDAVYGCSSTATTYVQPGGATDAFPDTIVSCNNQLFLYFNDNGMLINVNQLEEYDDSWNLLGVYGSPLTFDTPWKGFDEWIVVDATNIHGCPFIDTTFVLFNGGTFNFSLGPDVVTTNSNYTINAPAYPFYMYNWSVGGVASPELTVNTSGTYSLTIDNGQGCTYTDAINISFVVGMKEIENAAFQVYPNPAKDILSVKLEGFKNTFYTFYDITGRSVLTVNANKSGEQIINVSSLANGVYTLKAVSNDKVFSKKIVISK